MSPLPPGGLYLLQALGLGLTAGVLPGPLQAYLAAAAAQGGVRRALPVAFAPLLSDGPILLLVLVLLSRLPSWGLTLLSGAGGLFLLLLALRTWRAASAPRREGSRAGPGEQLRTAGAGALVNLLNPNPYVFWGTVGGPLLLAGWRRDPALGLGFLALFYGGIVGANLALALLFGQTHRFGETGRRRVLRVSALALGTFALLLLRSAWVGWG